MTWALLIFVLIGFSMIWSILINQHVSNQIIHILLLHVLGIIEGSLMLSGIFLLCLK